MANSNTICFLKKIIMQIMPLAFLMVFPPRIIAHEYEISIESKVMYYADILAEVINNPSQANLHRYEHFLQTENDAGIIDKIGFFMNSRQGFQGQFEFDIYETIFINPKHSFPTKSGISVDANIIININGFSIVGSIAFGLDTTFTFPQLSEIMEFFDNISTFVIEARSELSGIIDRYQPPPQGPADKSVQYGRNMWIHKTFYSDGKTTIGNFTLRESKRVLNGNPLFSDPYNLLAVKLDDININDFDHDYLIVADPAWNRLVCSDPTREWLFASGAYGSGTHEYRQPRGIDFMPGDWFVVADAHNRRAIFYQAQYDSLVFRQYLTHDNGCVQDVASCFNFHGGYGDMGEIAVLDKDNCRIDIYSVSHYHQANYLRSVFSYGSGERQLNDPTSICYDVTNLNGLNNNYIYVTDAGNNRVVAMKTSSPYDYYQTNYEFPSDAYLTSIDADAYGSVFVVDKANCTIYQFNETLEYLIATYGGCGTEDGQLFYPNKFKIADGWYFDSTAHPILTLGEAFVVEYYADYSGIRRFKRGLDILWHQLSFSPRPYQWGPDVFTLKWLQSGPDSIFMSVLFNNDVIYADTSGIHVAGYRQRAFVNSNALQEGYYVFETRAKSIFGTIDTTFRDSIFIEADDCGFTSYWTRTYNEYEKEKALDIDTTIYGDYIMLACGGSFYSDPNIYIKRLNTCGYPVWTHYRGGDGYHYSNSMTPTYDGGLVYVGDSATNYYAPSDIFVTKLNSEGTILWNKYMGGSQDQNSWCIEQTTDSGFIMTGEIDENMLIIKLNKYGDSLWSRVYGDSLGVGKKVIQTNDGGYAIYSDMYPGRVFKTDSQGDSIWSTLVIGNYGTLTNTCDGGYLMAENDGGETINFTKLTSNGAIAWLETISAPPDYAGISTGLETADENHGLAMAGFKSWPPGAFSERGPYLVRTNKCADSLWTKVFEDFPGDAYAYDVIQTGDGSFILAGETECALSSLKSIESVTDTSVPPIGTHDAFVIKIGPQPDQIAFLCGDVYVDGNVNLSDLLQLIEIVYNGAPKPDPRQRCDVNTDCSVNLLDVLRLLSFLYDNPPGPAPACP